MPLIRSHTFAGFTIFAQCIGDEDYGATSINAEGLHQDPLLKDVADFLLSAEDQGLWSFMRKHPSVQVLTITDAKNMLVCLDRKDMPAEGSNTFSAGARAMFDSLLGRCANHWHARPEIQKVCDAENKLITEWATDALESVSPNDCAKWRELSDMYQQGVEAGKKLAARGET